MNSLGGLGSVKVMYLDESGNHDLNRVDPNYPVFALGGVIIDRAYLRTVVGPALRAFKLKHFGREDVVLHTVEMTKGRGVYGFLAEQAKRDDFYTDLNALLAEWDYKVIVCVFDKSRYTQPYVQPADPYHYGLEILVERFCLELGSEIDGGYICAEKRNPGLDRELLAAWERLNTNIAGTGYAASKTIDEKIVGLELREKRPHLVGLQLADLVVTPVGRHVAGRPEKPDQVQWSVVEGKLRRVWGNYRGTGLIIRP